MVTDSMISGRFSSTDLYLSRAEPLMMDSFLSHMHIWAVVRESIHLANSLDLSTSILNVRRSILSRVTGTLHVSAMIKAGALR